MDKYNVLYLYHEIIENSTLKRNEVLISATTWMNLENIVLSERSQSQKTTYHMISIFEISRIGESVETK